MHRRYQETVNESLRYLEILSFSRVLNPVPIFAEVVRKQEINALTKGAWGVIGCGETLYEHRLYTVGQRHFLTCREMLGV